MLKRQEKIMGHLDRLAEMSLDLDNKKDARHVAKIQKWAEQVIDANDRDGEKCDETVDDADDMMVFDGEDGCNLNSQIFSALRSFSRTYGCNGRGNLPRQVTRRSKKLEENFERRKSCESAPVEPFCPWTKDGYLDSLDCSQLSSKCSLKFLDGCLKETFNRVSATFCGSDESAQLLSQLVDQFIILGTTYEDKTASSGFQCVSSGEWTQSFHGELSEYVGACKISAGVINCRDLTWLRNVKNGHGLLIVITGFLERSRCNSEWREQMLAMSGQLYSNMYGESVVCSAGQISGK